MLVQTAMCSDIDVPSRRTELIASAAEMRAHGSPSEMCRVIVNADDWGASIATTDRIFDCFRSGSLSSTSAMVFMADSQRAASLARENVLDAGLHLNLTQSFSDQSTPQTLRAHQERLTSFLRGGKRRFFFSPLLASSFEYVVKAQLEEFERLYGTKPGRIDGHHHAHLCANMQWQKLLPAGIVVRRNFTFAAGEKSWANRTMRAMQDRRLARRHRIADYFFDLQPFDAERLRRIVRLGRERDVEIECHPARDAEYKFLMEHQLEKLGVSVEVLRSYRLRQTGKMLKSSAVESRAVLPRQNPPTAHAKKPHICVCICTYKRPVELSRLLSALQRQETAGLFTFSVVVADNDEARSAEPAVLAAQPTMTIGVKYCTESYRGIARARNRVIANAEGDYFALIDDDEFPEPDWLLKLLHACTEYGVDGVLGPVKRHLETDAPVWLKRSRLYDRAVLPTGTPVAWRGARTGNALLKSEVFAGPEAPFRVEFTAGEDQDFFRRKIEEGRSFVWCSDAVVYEVLPPARWKRTYFMRKALLHGSFAARQADCGFTSIVKSIIAVPLYTLGLPFALAAGQHRFMTLLVKICGHAGKLLSLVHIRPIHDEYVSD
jgi:succinoglycan biosynthesis protein ExoM